MHFQKLPFKPWKLSFKAMVQFRDAGHSVYRNQVVIAKSFSPTLIDDAFLKIFKAALTFPVFRRYKKRKITSTMLFNGLNVKKHENESASAQAYF